MKLSQIANIMLGTTDLERSITFYRDSLGLAIKFQTPGFVFFDTGTVTLCLSEPHSKLGEVPGATPKWCSRSTTSAKRTRTCPPAASSS